MKFYTSILVLSLALVFSACSENTEVTKTVAEAKTPNKNKQKRQQAGIGPWAANQVMQPSELAAKIEDGSASEMKIFSIGPTALIPDSKDLGNMKSARNQEKFKAELSKLDKDAEIVVYCGCCPFRSCPNFKPAYKTLNDLGFTNIKLLNLKQNIKTDWIDKNYPTID